MRDNYSCRIFLLGVIFLICGRLVSTAQSFESISKETLVLKTGEKSVKLDSSIWKINEGEVEVHNYMPNETRLFKVLNYVLDSNFYVLLEDGKGEKFDLRIEHKEGELYWLIFTSLRNDAKFQTTFYTYIEN